MSEVHATMILPAANAPLARNLAAGLSPGGVGMFETGLSASGNAPATHYVSTGHIKAAFLDVMASGDALYAACQAAGAPVTLAQCNALVAASDVSQDAPFDAFARLGLQLVAESL